MVLLPTTTVVLEGLEGRGSGKMISTHSIPEQISWKGRLERVVVVEGRLVDGSVAVVDPVVVGRELVVVGEVKFRVEEVEEAEEVVVDEVVVVEAEEVVVTGRSWTEDWKPFPQGL